MPEYEDPTFIEEPLPAIVRANTRGGFPWEEKLKAIKQVPKGEHRRVYTFEQKNQATARANAIKRRWITAVPLEHVTTVVRQTEDGNFGVYLAHHGKITQEKRDELNAASADRGERVRVARAASTAAKSSESPAEAPTSAAERLAAAKAAKAS